MNKQDPELLRVQMKASKKIDLEGGSYISYQTGGLYLLPKTQAEAWIKKGVAIDPTVKKIVAPKEVK